MIDVVDEVMAFAAETRAAVYRRSAPAGGIDELARLAQDWSRSLSADAEDLGSGEAVSEGLATVVGAELASSAHALLHGAHDAGSGARLPRSELRAAEAALRGQLLLLRRAARSGRLSGCARTLQTLTGPLLADSMALQARGGSVGSDPARAVQAVRLGLLGRRLASAIASTVAVQRRLGSSRLRSSTAGIAERRAALSNNHVVLPPRPVGFEGQPPLTRLAVLVRVEGASWIDRGERPYTRLSLGDDVELRVHYKNALLEGVVARQWLWARCKVEPDAPDGTAYAVVEFEGPGTHAGTFWESWLQHESRQAYDIAPRSLDIAAEFPPIDEPHAELDLLARVGDGDAER